MWQLCWGVQTSAQGLPYLLSASWRICLKETETPSTTEGDDTAVHSEGGAARISAVLLAEMGIAQRPPQLGTSFSACLPARKGQNKRRSCSGASVPGQPLQGHLLHSCPRRCMAWSVWPSLLTAFFPPGLTIFSLLVLSGVESAPAAAVVQPGACRQLPENMGTASNLSAFIPHAQTITVPSVPVGQLLSQVSLLPSKSL